MECIAMELPSARNFDSESEYRGRTTSYGKLQTVMLLGFRRVLRGIMSIYCLEFVFLPQRMSVP